MSPSTGVQKTSFPGNAFLKVGQSLFGVSVGPPLNCKEVAFPLGSPHWSSSNYNEVSFKSSISALSKPTESTTATGASDFNAFLKTPSGHVCLPSLLFILERVTCAWFTQNLDPKRVLSVNETGSMGWKVGWDAQECKNPHVQSQTKTQLNAGSLLKWLLRHVAPVSFPIFCRHSEIFFYGGRSIRLWKVSAPLRRWHVKTPNVHFTGPSRCADCRDLGQTFCYLQVSTGQNDLWHPER